MSEGPTIRWAVQLSMADGLLVGTLGKAELAPPYDQVVDQVAEAPELVPDVVKEILVSWVHHTRVLIQTIEQSGVVQNGTPPGSPSRAIAAAVLDITQAATVLSLVFGTHP